MAQNEKVDPEPKPSGMAFTLRPKKTKPTRKYRKGSKYDPILEAFLKGPDALVSVTIPDRDANYIRTQLNKRIEAKGTKDVTVSVVNDVCYLEKASK